MKQLTYLLALIFLLVNCKSTEVEPIPTDIEAELGKEFTLENFQTANISTYAYENAASVQFKVKLVEAKYSECPQGVVCIVGSSFLGKLSVSTGAETKEVLFASNRPPMDTITLNNISYLINNKLIGTKVNKKTKEKEFKSANFIIQKL